MCSRSTPAYPWRFAAIPSPSHRASASPAARTCARPRSWSSRIAFRMSRPGSKQAKRMSSSLAWWKRSAYDRTKSRPSRIRPRSASDRASKRSMTAGRTARNRLICRCSSTSAFIGGEYEKFRAVSGLRFRGSGSATTWPGDTIPAILAISVPSSSGERLWISTMSASRHVPTLHGTHPMRYSSRRVPTGGYFPMISLIGVRRYFSMCAPPMGPILPQGRHAVLDADQPGTPLIVGRRNGFAHPLRFAPQLLPRQAALLRSRRRTGLLSGLDGFRGLFQPLDQAIPRVLAVSFPRPETAGLDHQHAVSRHPLPCEPDQPLPHPFGQGPGVAHVEAHLDRRRDLVDVLPAGPGGADEPLLEIALVDADLPPDPGHSFMVSRMPRRMFLSSTEGATLRYTFIAEAQRTAREWKPGKGREGLSTLPLFRFR